MKVCKGCGAEKDRSLFYKHNRMKDGLLNFCIECAKEKVKKNRLLKSDYYKEFDKQRANLPHRAEARKEYLKTESGKAARQKALANYKQRHPLKRAAHIIVGNALRNGSLVKPDLCSQCGSNSNIEGHHDDYTKPLDVRWLCNKCHNQWHRENKPIFS